MLAFNQSTPAVLSPVIGVIPLVTVGPSLVFFVLFLRHSFKRGQGMYRFLALLFVVSSLNQVAMIMSTFVSSDLERISVFLASQVLEALAMLLLLFVLEMFEKNKPFSWQMMLLSALVAMLIGSLVTGTSYEQVQAGPFTLLVLERRSPAAVLLLLFSVFSSIWLLAKFIGGWRSMRGKRQKGLFTWLFIGILLSQSGGALVPGLLDLSLGSRELLFAPSVGFLKIIGTMIVGIAFLRVSKTPWLLQRQRVHLLLVFSKQGGLPLFSRTFREDLGDQEMMLLTGAITALSSVFKEFTKEESPIESINFQGKVLRILDRPGFICALLVDYLTPAAEAALVNFTREFEARFALQVDSFTGDVSVFDEASDIASKFFN